jgi:hypothetical protein
MKRSILCFTAVVMACALMGCATQKTKTGRNTNVLGGLARVNTGSYQAASPTTVGVEVGDLVGRNNPSGTKVSLLWGLITLTDN